MVNKGEGRRYESVWRWREKDGGSVERGRKCGEGEELEGSEGGVE